MDKLLCILFLVLSMKIDGVEIGGVEPGTVTFHLTGDIKKAEQLKGFSRKILGNHKRDMFLGDFTGDVKQQYSRPFQLSDGTVIQAHSVMGGLVDMDNVFIHVPIFGGEVKYRCLGYIVQGFASDDENGTDFSNAFTFDYKVILPSGDELGFNSDIGGATLADLENFIDYPDNGARYINADITEIDESITETDHQEVYVKHSEEIQNYTGLGPITVRENTDIGIPPINAGWEYAYSYTFSSGTCGINPITGLPETWNEESNPCTSTFKVRINYSTGEVLTDLGYQLSGVDYYYPGGHHIAIGIITECHRDNIPDMPWTGTGYSMNDWLNAVGEYEHSQLLTPIVVQAFTQANEIGYNDWMTNWYNDTEYKVYENLFSISKISTIYRREDDKGFVTGSGFYFDDDKTIFTRNKRGYGEGSVFMIPTDDTKRYRYSDEIRDENIILEEETTFVNSVGVVSGYEDDSCWQGAANGNLNGDDWLIVEGRDNLQKDYSLEWAMAGDFGMPIKVEEGIHTVKIKSDGFTHGRFKVYLLIDGIGLINKEIARIDMTQGGDDNGIGEKKLTIKIGELTDPNNLGEILNVVDL